MSNHPISQQLDQPHIRWSASMRSTRTGEPSIAFEAAAARLGLCAPHAYGRAFPATRAPGRHEGSGFAK